MKNNEQIIEQINKHIKQIFLEERLKLVFEFPGLPNDISLIDIQTGFVKGENNFDDILKFKHTFLLHFGDANKQFYISTFDEYDVIHNENAYVDSFENINFDDDDGYGIVEIDDLEDGEKNEKGEIFHLTDDLDFLLTFLRETIHYQTYLSKYEFTKEPLEYKSFSCSEDILKIARPYFPFISDLTVNLTKKLGEKNSIILHCTNGADLVMLYEDFENQLTKLINDNETN